MDIAERVHIIKKRMLGRQLSAEATKAKRAKETEAIQSKIRGYRKERETEEKRGGQKKGNLTGQLMNIGRALGKAKLGRPSPIGLTNLSPTIGFGGRQTRRRKDLFEPTIKVWR